MPALLLFTLAFACVNDPEDVLALEARLDGNIEVGEVVRITFSDSGIVRGIIDAPIMLNHLEKSRQRQEFVDGLKVYFLDEFRDTSSTLTAKWGEFDRRSREITVRDSVVWESTDLQRLETEELKWNEKTERIHTNKFVVLRQPDYIIMGYGLEADQGFTDARVMQVTGRVPVSRAQR